MFAKRWVQWILGLVVLIAMGVGIGTLLRVQGASTSGKIVIDVTALAAHLWLAGGVFAWVQTRWLLWLLAHFGILVAAAVLGWPLHQAGESGLTLTVLGAAGVLRILVVIRAFVRHPRLILPVIFIVASGDIFAICRISWETGHVGTAIVISGAAGITFVFAGGLWLIRVMLSGPYPVFGVARTLIDEAIRIKVALIFIVTLFLIVPLLPTLQDPNLRLQYQVQTFLSWSLMAVFTLLGLMTVFLACATICNEIDRRQIFLTMTKPVGRMQYLVGKWLGIVLLNLLLVVVLSCGIYVFARMLQATGTPRDSEDWVALNWQVLTARRTVFPRPEDGWFKESVDRRIKELQLENKQRYARENLTDADWTNINQTLMTRWHTISPGNPQTYYFHDLQSVQQRASDARQKRERDKVEHLANLAAHSSDAQEAGRLHRLSKTLAGALGQIKEVQRTIKASADTSGEEATRLEMQARKLATQAQQQYQKVHQEAQGDLGALIDRGPAEVLQFRFKPRAMFRPSDDLIVLRLRINGRALPNDRGEPIHTLANDNFHILDLPAEVINDEGSLVLEIANFTGLQPGDNVSTESGISINFTPGEDLEILYNSGGFEGNLVRSAAIVWIVLSFLGMLGLMAGTFLGFPVACVSSLLVFITAALSGYVSDSLNYYVPIPKQAVEFSDKALAVWHDIVNKTSSGELWEAFKLPMGLAGKGFTAIIPSFHEHNPIPLLTDGRLVSMGKLGGAFLWVGLVGTGLCALIAWLAFRRRELARVMV